MNKDLQKEYSRGSMDDYISPPGRNTIDRRAGVTGRQICELVAEWIENDIGVKKKSTPEIIWDASLVEGGLQHLLGLYELALAKKTGLI